MNILFVYSLEDIQSPDKPLSQPESMNFGLAYISAVLKQQGHTTRLVILSRLLGEDNKARLDKFIAEFQPQLMLWSAVSTEYPFIADMAGYVKNKYPQLYHAIGGAHASLNPDGILDGPFDALCISEGEQATVELASQLAQGKTPSGIPNLWLKHGAEIEKNPTRVFIDDLDQLPFPDRQLWQEWISNTPEARYSVLLGRGCPFNCTYCSNHALRKLAPGRYVRFRSADNIVAEIKDIALQLKGKKEIYLEVETFGVDKVWAMDLFAKLTALNKELPEPLTFGANIRVTPNCDFEDLFAACHEANFNFINIGLESGSDRVRRAVLKRIYDNQDVLRTVAAARRHGLKVALFNMIGLPGETLADFKETIAVNRACQPDWHMTSIFYPYPGTDLYFLCRDQGMLGSAKKVARERVQSALNMSYFTKWQIQHSFVWFDWYVYKGYKPWYKLLLKVAATKLRTKPKLHYQFRRLMQMSWLRALKNKLKA